MSDVLTPYELPLFPLNTVLFPRMALPLRIFEPRYRQMLDYCMERDRTFGVVLIRAGMEVGGPAEPYRVGTVARVREVQPQSDGTLAVTTVGVHRFSILDVVQQRPYLVGVVEDLPDEPEAAASAVDAVREVAQRCLRLTLAMTSEWVRHPDLPKDPAQLSYMLSARLQRGNRTKQRLLEAATTAERLRQLQPLLEREEAYLAQQVQERQWLLSVNLN